MRLGLGLSLASTSGAVSIFDPATLALSDFHKPDYAGTSPWAGTASLGSSGDGNHYWGAASPPVTGTAVNGHVPVHFASSKYMVANLTVDQYFGAHAYDIIMLVKAASAAAPSGAAINDPPFLGEAAGNFGLSFSTNGVAGVHYDGVYRETTPIAMSAGSWHMIRMRYNGTNVAVSVDNGAPQTVNAGDLSSMSSLTLQLSKNYTATFQPFDCLETIISPTVISDPNVASIKARFNSLYGLSI
jgi:hypothetical protein